MKITSKRVKTIKRDYCVESGQSLLESDSGWQDFRFLYLVFQTAVNHFQASKPSLRVYLSTCSLKVDSVAPESKATFKLRKQFESQTPWPDCLPWCVSPVQLCYLVLLDVVFGLNWLHVVFDSFLHVYSTFCSLSPLHCYLSPTPVTPRALLLTSPSPHSCLEWWGEWIAILTI